MKYVAQMVRSVLLALLFLGAGLAKLAGAKVSRADAERFGFRMRGSGSS